MSIQHGTGFVLMLVLLFASAGCSVPVRNACPRSSVESHQDAVFIVREFLNIDDLAAQRLSITGARWDCVWILRVALSDARSDSGMDVLVDENGNARRMTEDDWMLLLGDGL
jgi:hypothetical protein